MSQRTKEFTYCAPSSIPLYRGRESVAKLGWGGIRDTYPRIRQMTSLRLGYDNIASKGIGVADGR